MLSVCSAAVYCGTDAPLSDDKLKKLPGVTYTFILGFCCVASGKVTYALRRDQGSAELAFLIATVWIRYNGVPTALWAIMPLHIYPK